MAEDQKKVTKKMGNPNWHKGMPHPEGAGRPKGVKDSPFAPRVRKKLGGILWQNMEECAKRDKFPNLASWIWNEAKTDPEFKTLLRNIVLDKLGTVEVGETQERLALAAMVRDTMVAEAQASGESGNSGNTVNVIMPPVLQATEAMRKIDKIEILEADEPPDDLDNPDEPVEAEDVEDD